MTREELINRITAIAGDKGWNVYVEKNCGESKSLGFDFAQHTDRSQGFSFYAEMEN